MSADVPAQLDAWRMVAARRRFEGGLPLAGMIRLRDLLADAEGEARYVLEFDRDDLQGPYVALRVEAALPLICQRSLRRFLLPVTVEQRYGLVSGEDEADDAALPPDYEALQVGEDGYIDPRALVEDELILAVPLVPVMPGSEAVERDWVPEPEESAASNPFSALAALKKN